MPLEVLPDRFSNAEHNKLDKAVNEASQDFINCSAQQILPFQPILLLLIVENSNNKLDPKFKAHAEARTLINTHTELQDMLSASWERKSYRDIRSLAILAPEPRQKSPELQSLHRRLSRSFKGEYYGAAVDGLYEYLTYNEEIFRKNQHYGKFCSIVQSSGTGKSRMLTELANKGVITIYMNLRDKGDVLSFPLRDETPSMLLTDFPNDESAYRAYCYAFFIALFRTVTEYLPMNQATSGTTEDVMCWAREMCDVSDPPQSTRRMTFFAKLVSNYRKSYDDLRRKIQERPGEPSGVSASGTDDMDMDTELHTVIRQFGELSKPNKKGQPHPEAELSLLLKESFEGMARSLGEIFPERTTEPKLVIAIDEAHPLTAWQRDYQPANVFCRIVKEYSCIGAKDHGVWVVFASTTSKIADFSPPNEIYNSNRVALENKNLFPPYTRLGWDQSAPQLRAIDPEDVSQAKNIVGFGRPLWVSLKNGKSGPDQVLKTASQKLCGAQHYDPHIADQVLAVLGQRFAIKITLGHQDSLEHLENGVASHLRICLATTLDRTWMFTSYPSEPLLSCVASTNLHWTTDTLRASLLQLLYLINASEVDMGERGELASRLLWLLAKDLFIRDKMKKTNAFPSDWDQHLIDCEMIPVVDWLEFIFGPRVWDEESRKAFENAYINFSHWTCMVTDIAGSGSDEELPLNVWTSRHWRRTSAVQCSHQQPLVDKVIPIYFKGTHGSASAEDRMSQILISDKNGGSKSSEATLYSISRMDDTIGGKQSAGSLPYIAILVDLARKPSSFSVTFQDQDVGDHCLRICAAGVDTTTYPFLTNYPDLLRVLEELVRLQKVRDRERYFSQCLDAQMKFGSTATAEHMDWERGRESPPGPLQPVVWS